MCKCRAGESQTRFAVSPSALRSRISGGHSGLLSAKCEQRARAWPHSLDLQPEGAQVVRLALAHANPYTCAVTIAVKRFQEKQGLGHARQDS
jgi:hypothetical protein